jgi:putative transposase
VVRLCDLLDVPTSSYYDWCGRQKSSLEIENEELLVRAKEIFHEQRNGCGTRTIKRALKREGKTVSRQRIGQLMEKSGLYCKTRKKFKATTNSKHDKPIAENILNRNFTVDTPNTAWVGDITYIRTAEGWLYLATVIDLFSRRVVGFSMDKTMTAKLVNDALKIALMDRNPPAGLIWHTDRGSQYASDSHRKILAQHGIIQSMSRKGNCWDNAVAEIFFRTLKSELVYHKRYKTRVEAEADIFEYIEVFYNRKRFHSALDYRAPIEFEELSKAA